MRGGPSEDDTKPNMAESTGMARRGATDQRLEY